MKVYATERQLQFLIIQSKVKVKTKALQQQKHNTRQQPQQQLIKLQTQLWQQQQEFVKQTRNFDWTTAGSTAALNQQQQQQRQRQRQPQKQQQQQQYQRNNNEGVHYLLRTKQIPLQLQQGKLACIALADLLLLLVLQLVAVKSTWLVSNAVPGNKSKLNSLKRRD